MRRGCLGRRRERGGRASSFGGSLREIGNGRGKLRPGARKGAVTFLVRMYTYQPSGRIAVILCVFQAVRCHVATVTRKRTAYSHSIFWGDIFREAAAGKDKGPLKSKTNQLQPYQMKMNKCTWVVRRSSRLQNHVNNFLERHLSISSFPELPQCTSS